MYDLNKKIDEYSEEVFVDLGLTSLTEEKKADLYARIQEHLHRTFIEILSEVLNVSETKRITHALEQEDYQSLNKILKKYPQFKTALETKVDQEFKNLKLIIRKEQENAGTGSGTSRQGTAAAGA